MARGFKNSISNVFGRMVSYSIIIALITIIIGLLLLLLPEQSNRLVGLLAGITVLLSGLEALYKYFKRDGAKIYSLNLVFGVVFTIIGLLLVLYPYKLMQFVTICFGLYIIINGLSKINSGVWLRRGSERSWLITIVAGALMVVIGLLVLFDPFANLTLTRLVGAFLLMSGIIDLTDAIMFRLRSEEIMEIFW